MDNSKERASLNEAEDEKSSLVAPIVDSFAGRISKRLEEKERAESASAQASHERYQTIMQGLTIIRKALQEACKIRLGSRFCLATTITDSDGWPKITLHVRDMLAPGWNDLFIQAHANDRQADGLLFVENQSGKRLLQISVVERNPLERLPIHLKKALRTFLDEVGAYVLDPRRPEDLLTTQTKKIETSESAEPAAPTHNPLSDEDMFDENFQGEGSVLVEESESAPLVVDIFKKK